MGGGTPWRAAGSDRGSFWLIQVAQLLAIGLGLLARSRVPSADLSLAVWALGIVVMVGGALMRVWALRALGAQFRRDVVVETDQTVVTAGPYRWVRHPAYTGSLMIFGGLGLALANWLSLLVLVALPLAAYLWRIRIEEAELQRVLGDTYRSYAHDRARLIPHVW